MVAIHERNNRTSIITSASGGTRFFGIHMVSALLKKGHKLAIATRGNTKKSKNRSKIK